MGRRWWKQGTLSLGPGSAEWHPAFASAAGVDFSSGYRLVRVQDLGSSDWNVKRRLFRVIVLEAADGGLLELAVPKLDVPLVTEWLEYQDKR